MDMLTLALAKKSGVSSWNDLKDKPFGYGEQWSEIAYAFATTATDKNNGYGSITLTTNGNKLVVGEKYKVVVTWGGIEAEYEFTATGSSSSRLLGKALEGDVYVYDIAPMGGMTAYVKGSSATFMVPYTVHIFHSTLTYIPLDEKYMPTLTSPNGTKYKITVADDGTLTTTAV